MRQDHARNAIDLLRLLAAWAVLYSHQYALLGFPEPALWGLYSWGEVGIGIFFFLSGVLVWRSWCRDPHPGRYFARRSLRIFPGLWVLVLLTIGVLGPVLTSLPWQEYWASGETWHYLQTLVLFNPKGLPGVFDANPYAVAVNGSLWSLKVEFFAYILVAIVGAWSRGRFALGAALLALLAVLPLAGYAFWTGHTIAHLEVLALFGLGALAGQWVNSWQKGQARSLLVSVLSGMALLVYLSAPLDGWGHVGLLLIVGVPVVLAFSITWGHRLTSRLGDVSYGIYIYAFPVQQTLAHLVPQWSFGAHLAAATACTLALATLSWHGVEKLALRFKPRTRNAAVASADGLIQL